MDSHYKPTESPLNNISERLNKGLDNNTARGRSPFVTKEQSDNETSQEPMFAPYDKSVREKLDHDASKLAETILRTQTVKELDQKLLNPGWEQVCDGRLNYLIHKVNKALQSADSPLRLQSSAYDEAKDSQSRKVLSYDIDSKTEGRKYREAIALDADPDRQKRRLREAITMPSPKYQVELYNSKTGTIVDRVVPPPAV
ncbi:MAG: hypothetical protein K2W95_02525 [Candidatus Obscuribacterales bacterium]|nr:hypothetical protein [Candidatus Obscuribacterales bacterium]